MPSDSSQPAVLTRALRRVYKSRRDEVVALHGVDIHVRQGELFGVLGPNGAGKTTLIKILVTLLLPSGGEAYVDGLDVVKQYRELRPRISMVSGGESSGYGMLHVREQLWLFSQLYGMPSKAARARIDELLESLGLAFAARRRVNSLSSGMRQKMNLVRGLLPDPRVLFLDEPTVALDVGAARDVRREVRHWMAENPTRTIILTTHYMQEADELCDRVAIVNAGRVVAEGTPAELKSQVREDVIVDLELEPGEPVVGGLRALEGVLAASAEARNGVDSVSVILADDAALPAVLAVLQTHRRAIRGLLKREPTLEDAFVRLTGRGIAEAEAETQDQATA